MPYLRPIVVDIGKNSVVTRPTAPINQQAPDEAQGALPASRCPDTHAEGTDEHVIRDEERVDEWLGWSADSHQFTDGSRGVAVVVEQSLS
jgi:hypothetical protein